MSDDGSFESRYFLGEASWSRRRLRDLRLLGSSAGFLWLWLTRGRRVRLLVREAEREGRVVCLEDLFGSERKP